jgi:hypothetical protein
MKKNVIITILLFIITVTLTGCLDINDQFIQGTWGFANEGGDEKSGNAHVLREWTFSNGSFSYINEIFMGFPDTLTGMYRIKDSGKDFIMLELYNTQGNLSYGNNVELQIKIDPDNDTLRVQGELYYRLYPQR